MSGKEMCLLRREFDGPSHSESLWRALDLKLRRREVTQTTLYFQIDDLYWGMEQLPIFIGIHRLSLKPSRGGMSPGMRKILGMR